MKANLKALIGKEFFQCCRLSKFQCYCFLPFSFLNFPGACEESAYNLLTAFSEHNVIMLRQKLKQIYIQGYQLEISYFF